MFLTLDPDKLTIFYHKMNYIAVVSHRRVGNILAPRHLVEHLLAERHLENPCQTVDSQPDNMVILS